MDCHVGNHVDKNLIQRVIKSIHAGKNARAVNGLESLNRPVPRSSSQLAILKLHSFTHSKSHRFYTIFPNTNRSPGPEENYFYHAVWELFGIIRRRHLLGVNAPGDFSTNCMIGYSDMIEKTRSVYEALEIPQALPLKDPRGPIIVPNLTLEKYLMPRFSFGVTLSIFQDAIAMIKFVIMFKDKAKFHNEMRCLKTLSKFVKSLMYGVSILWDHFLVSRGNKYNLVVVVIFQKWVEANALPQMLIEL
ncbi:hypothetical protein Tco_0152953 [Tanacetum coccineum]